MPIEIVYITSLILNEKKEHAVHPVQSPAILICVLYLRSMPEINKKGIWLQNKNRGKKMSNPDMSG